MDTMTTVEAVERTPSGAFKITLLGGAVAGTYDEEIGALAEKLAAAGDEGNPAAVVLEVEGGRTYLKAMREIEPPPELDGPAEEAPAVGEAAAEIEPHAHDAADAILAAHASNAATDMQVAAALPSSVLVEEIAERLARLDGVDK